jgi:hypothetical protein
MNAAKTERFSVYSYSHDGSSSYRGDAYTLPKAIKIANSFARSPSYAGAFITGKKGAVVWDSKHPRRNGPRFKTSDVSKVARELTKFGFSAPEARRLAAQAEGERGIVNWRETVERIVRAHTHKTVGGTRDNPNRLRPRAKRNPGGRGHTVRIGRAVEVRYRRDIGRKPGYYKHEIRSRNAGVYTIPPGWVYVSTKSILITEREPRVSR